MNKNRLRNLFERGILILGALVFLVNCQKEEEVFNPDSKIKTKGGYKISIVDEYEVAQNKNLATKLEKITKARSHRDPSNQKDVYNAEHSFTINTDRVKYIENNDGYHSYTFPILRDVDNGLLENLVFSSQDDGTYDTFMVTYDLTIDQQNNLLAGLEVDLEGKVTKTEVNNLGLPTDLMGKVTADCVLIVTEYCSCGQHPNPDGTYAGCSINCYSTSSAEHCTGGAISNNDPDDNPPNTDTDTSGSHQEGGGQGTGGATSPTCTRNCIDEVCSSSLALTNLTSSLNLSPTLADCLQSDDKCEEVKALEEFYEAHPNETLFIEAAAQAICEGGELDSGNAIILDPTVINNQKIKCVYDKLKGLSNTIFKDIINNQFGSSNTNHVQITLGNIPAQLANTTQAYTYTNYNAINTNLSPGTIKHIRIDPNFVANASTLEIALVLIHEFIHAELIDRCIKLDLIQSVNALGAMVLTQNTTVFELQHIIFNQLLIQYNAFSSPGSPGNPEWNHNLFNALSYRTKMAQNLTSIHPLLNSTTNDFLTNVNNDPSIVGGPYTLAQLMGYISWIGLEGTQEYSTVIGNGTAAENQKNYVEGVTNTKYENICTY